MTISLEKSTFEWLEVGDNKVDIYGVNSSEKFAKKSGKLKGQKLFKSQKTLKSEKNNEKVGICLNLVPQKSNQTF